MKATYFDAVAHVGEMDLNQKNSGSYHGARLAVARHPAAWGRIAKIGTTGFVLRRHAGAFRFLDCRSMSDDEQTEVTNWAVTCGYLAKTPRFKVSYTDPETNERQYLLYTSADEAEDQQEELDDASLNFVETLVATNNLIAATDQIASQRDKITGGLAFDLALTCYAEQLLDFDGVWWSDKLNPLAYSAPFGTLFRPNEFVAVGYDFSDFTDTDELEDAMVYADE